MKVTIDLPQVHAPVLDAIVKKGDLTQITGHQAGVLFELAKATLDYMDANPPKPPPLRIGTFYRYPDGRKNTYKVIGLCPDNVSVRIQRVFKNTRGPAGEVITTTVNRVVYDISRFDVKSIHPDDATPEDWADFYSERPSRLSATIEATTPEAWSALLGHY